ncbi:MAG TPA: efflux RND transporter permease subunit, partial [Burkholderiaceae bacterium]|nr:efflux RND transporter permease subunit [Burkholderiaceae bacterium]
NAAMGFVLLKDWQQRPDPSQSVFSLAGQSMGAFSQIKDAFAFAFYPPPIISLGNASGFDFQLVDRAKVGHEALMQARNQVLAQAAQNPKLMGVRPNGLGDVSQFNINIDSERAAAMGLALSDINQTLQIAWGSSYINDYLDQGAIKRVYIQAEAPYRMSGQDLRRWYVRNQEQKMVPFDAFSSAQWSYGSPRLERFNGQASVNIQGAPAPGVSTGAAMQAIEQIVAQIGNGVGLEWSGLSYEERQSGAQAPMLYALSLLIVFLALAALYESWIVPAAVLLVAPLGLLGAVVASNVFGLNNDVYFQVALLTTVGLVSKNAILIIEFARNQKQQGQALMQAVALAARQRFRPILMTSFAFVLGVTPLALASGAGAASQNAIGIAVIGGMFAATFLAIFFVPMFYVGIEKLFDRGAKTARPIGD